MIIGSVTLHNIRSYIKETIEFPEGSVLLTGDIGSGKSTILLAIEFAIFGITPNLSGNALLRKGKTEGFVELSLKIADKMVIIKRFLKRERAGVRQNAGTITIDGIKEEAMPDELRAKIVGLLHYPTDIASREKSLLYRFTVFTPQEEMKQILYEKQDYRLDTLRKVFGIDKYKRAKENCAILLQSIKEKRKLSLSLVEDFDQKTGAKAVEEKRLDEIKSKITKLMPLLSSALDGLNKIKIEIEKDEKAVMHARVLKSKLDSCTALLNEKQAQIFEANENLAKTEQGINLLSEQIKAIAVADYGNTSDEIGKEILEKNAKYNDIVNTQTADNERHSAIIARIGELNKEIDVKKVNLKLFDEKQKELDRLLSNISAKQSVEEKILEIEKKLDVVKAGIQEHNVIKREAENAKSDIAMLEHCPLCKQKVSEQHRIEVEQSQDKIIAEAKNAIILKNEEKTRLETEIFAIKQQLEIIKNNELEIQKIKSEINYLKETNAEIIVKKSVLLGLQEEEKVLLKKIEAGTVAVDLKKEIQELLILQKKITDNELIAAKKANLEQMLLEKIESRASIKKSIAAIYSKSKALADEKALLTEELHLHKDAEERLANFKKELDILREKEKDLQITKAELEKEQEGINHSIAQLDIDIEKMQTIKKEIIRLSLIEQWLNDFFISVVSLMEKQVMLKVYHEFNDLFMAWFGMIVEDEAVSIRLGEDFSPVAVQNGYEIEIENLSGGEKTAIALAYRLALNKVITDLIEGIEAKDLIILDEPTDGFSSQQLDRIRDVINELHLRQVIIVSHEEKIETFVDHVIRVVKEGHESRIQ